MWFSFLFLKKGRHCAKKENKNYHSTTQREPLLVFWIIFFQSFHCAHMHVLVLCCHVTNCPQTQQFLTAVNTCHLTGLEGQETGTAYLMILAQGLRLGCRQAVSQGSIHQGSAGASSALLIPHGLLGRVFYAFPHGQLHRAAPSAAACSRQTK